MTVQVHAVEQTSLCIGGRLAAIFNDFIELNIRQRKTRNGGKIKVRIQRCRLGKFRLSQYAHGRSDSSQARRKLNEDTAPESVNALRQIAPAGHNGTRTVYARESTQFTQLGYCRVYAVTYRNKPRSQ